MMLEILFLYVTYILAQAPTCNTGNNLPTFTVCVRDALMGNSGNKFEQVTEACQSVVLNQKAYYSCLCDKNAAVVNCFNLFCPGEQSATGFAQSQIQFCAAIKGLGGATSSVTPASSATLNPTIASPTASSSLVSSPTSTPANSEAMHLISPFWFFLSLFSLLIFLS